MDIRASAPGQTGAPDEYRSPMTSGRARAADEPRRLEPQPPAATAETAGTAGTADPEDPDELGPMPPNTGDPDAYRSPMATGRAFGGEHRGPRPGGFAGRAKRGEYRSPMASGRSGKAGEYRSPMTAGRPADARDARPPQRPRPAQKRPMFAITCATCGKAAEVPFKPAEGREVHCQDCFRARKQGPS